MFQALSRLLIALIVIVLSIIPTQVQANHDAESPIISNNQGHPSCAAISLDNLMMPDCSSLIAAQPTPNVSRVPVDFGVVSNTRFLRFSQSEITVYDAPDGNVIRAMSLGYTYITPAETQQGWARLAEGGWISTRNAQVASPSQLSGVIINGHLDMPFAWVLWNLNATSSPAGLVDRETGAYQRYQLVNIYATVNVNGWNWHLVGPNHWINQRNLSIVYPQAPADIAGRWVGVNLYEQNIVAYENNALIMATLVSSGLKDGKWDTPTGTFTIGVRLEADRMAGAEGKADYYSLDNVPYAQYFNGLISPHGTYWHDSFGFPHSHGCVNLSISDSRWLFEWLAEGSTVHVYTGG